MKYIIIMILLLTITVTKAEMLSQEQTVIKAISSAQENDLENFIKYVRLMEVYGYNGKDYPPYKLLKFLKEIDLKNSKTELQKKDIVILDDSNLKIEFIVRYWANQNVRDEKQYAVSRVRIIK